MARAVPWLCCSAIIALLLAFVSRDYPLLSVDFSYFLPRLVDTDLHYRINGLSIQWYTPSFGGGLPAFANPQHLQFSLLQALTYVSNPWLALLLSVVMVSVAGYVACYRFLIDTIKCQTVPAALGAAFFLGNGFYIEHVTGGQIGFQLWPLSAVILYALFNRRLTTAASAGLVALSVAMMVHHAGAFMVIVTAGSLAIAAPILHFISRSAIDWWRTTRTAAIGAIGAIALAGSKVYVTQSLMHQFPRELSDRYDIGWGHALFGLGSQLAGAMTIVPILIAGQWPPQRVEDALIRATGAGVSLTELDVSLSPVLLGILVVGGIRFLNSLRTSGWPLRGRADLAMVALLMVTTWIAIETTLARGVIYPLLHQLPVFKSLHVNHRVAGVFILPLAIAGAAILQRWYAARPPQWQVAALVCLTIAAPISYLAIPPHVHRRNFDVTQTLVTHEQVKNGERFAVTRIDDMQDYDTFAQRASSLETYEPLFGYDRENWTPRIQRGSIETERNGSFNMTNPASLVFPDFLGAKPFDLIPTTDRANLEAFAARRQPDWPIPRTATWLNRIALAALAGCFAILIAEAWRPRARPL